MPIGRYENDAIRRLRAKRRSGVQGAWGLDREIAWVAERQGGHIHRDQLRDLGLGGRGVDHRLATGRLHRAGWCTYCVGPPRGDREARVHAALLIAGDGAAISHRAGGRELGLVSGATGAIDITVPTRKRPADGVVYHRTRLPPDELTLHEGLPVTTVGRTLFDLAGCVDEFSFRRAVKEVSVQRLDCRPTLQVLLDRHPRSPGAPLIRAVITEGAAPAGVVPTDGEERFLAIVRRGGFPPPAHRYGISVGDRWFEVDFAWPELGVVVEVDSSFHEVPIAFETDRDRDQELLAAGWRVFRVTWRQLHDDPGRVLHRFRAFFARAYAAPSGSGAGGA